MQVNEVSSQRIFDRRFARRLRRLIGVYWTSPAAKGGALLLLLAVALELGAVYGTVLLADAQKRVGDAVQDKQSDAFFAGIALFLAIVLGFVLVSAYRVYVRQVLEMRWRQQVTAHYLSRWIGPEAYQQKERHPAEADNPDQRIAEDIRNFVASSLGLALSLLSAVATLVSFAGLLWNLSADWPLRIRGEAVSIPGLMMWIAILYSLLAMGLTHLVGRALVPINFDRQRVEADFRYGLIRFRENAEAVALARGADFERRGALGRFEAVIGNWLQLIRAQRRLTLTTTSIAQANAVLPLLIAAPAYFAGWLTLGSVAQTRVAYAQVSGALAWFVYAYQEIAQWRASVERLSTLAELLDKAHDELSTGDRIHITEGAEPELRVEDLKLLLPDGRVLLAPTSGAIAARERVAILGGAGVGKTTLFRALAGLWPYGSGRVLFPRGARSMFVTQRPYLPIGTLRDVVSYPSASGTFEDAAVHATLEELSLGRLAGRLDDTVSWDQHLSADEQQRLSIARVLLHAPDWIFLDDATAAMDETMEEKVYAMLFSRFPEATVVTMTRRESVAALHSRQWRVPTSEPGPAPPAETAGA